MRPPEPTPLFKDRRLWVVLAAALLLRVAYLAYNRNLDLPAVWSGQARSALTYAQIATGAPVEGADISVEEARALHAMDDNGLDYVHILIARLSGRTSFFRMQMLQTALDMLLLLAVVGIGGALGGRPVALLSGGAYAVYWPQWWLAAIPGYDFWASLGLVWAAWALVRGRELMEGRLWAACAFAALAGALSSLSGTVRSTVMYFGPFSALLFPFLVGAPARRKALFSLAILVGWAVGAAPKIYQNAAQGPSRLVRSTVGHSFWAGVGQFPNPYGVENTDESVANFYIRETGVADTENMHGRAYNEFLLRKAGEYIRTHPWHYFSSCLKRALGLLSGEGLRVAGPVADIWALEESQREAFRQRAAAKLELRGRHGFLLGSLLYIMRFPGRYLPYGVILLFPLGLFWALFRERRDRVRVALLPMLYTLATLAPFYYTPRNAMNAYAATLPLCVLGFWSFFARRRGLDKGIIE